MPEQRKSYFRNLFTSILNEALRPDRRDVNELGDLLVELVGDEADRTQQEGVANIDIKLRWRRALYLKKVKEALFRLNREDFGQCEDCSGLIEDQRLIARPTATKCIACKEEEEQVENHILYKRRSHTLGNIIESGEIMESEFSAIEREKSRDRTMGIIEGII